MKTHTITIKQDMSCESTNVFFYSTISLSSGISMIQPRVRVIIDDSGETECGKCLAQNRPHNIVLSLLF